MALHEKIDQLVTKLMVLTEAGKVTWDATADEDTFLTTLGKFVVTLKKEERHFGAERYNAFRFKILDAGGKALEEAYEVTQTNDWERLRTLHDLARRKALHVEEALSDLLASLEHI